MSQSVVSGSISLKSKILKWENMRSKRSTLWILSLDRECPIHTISGSRRLLSSCKIQTCDLVLGWGVFHPHVTCHLGNHLWWTVVIRGILIPLSPLASVSLPWDQPGGSDQSPTPWLDTTRSNPLSYNPIYGRTSRGLERWWFTSDTKTWCKCIDNTFYTQKTIEMSQMTPILHQKRLCFTFGKNPGQKS